jgi:hypothetical protein
MGKPTPLTREVARLVFDAPDGFIPIEEVLYHAGRLVPPGVAIRAAIYERERQKNRDPQKRKPPRERTTEETIALGRRYVVNRSIMSLVMYGRVVRVIQNGIAGLAPATHPRWLTDATLHPYDEAHTGPNATAATG